PILMVLFAYGAATLFGVRTCFAVPMQKGKELFAVPAVDIFYRPAHDWHPRGRFFGSHGDIAEGRVHLDRYKASCSRPRCCISALADIKRGLMRAGASLAKTRSDRARNENLLSCFHLPFVAFL